MTPKWHRAQQREARALTARQDLAKLQPGQIIVSAESFRITKDIYDEVHGVPAGPARELLPGDSEAS